MADSKKGTIVLQDEHTDQLSLERLIFFSDAVIAIAITLLALEIRLPESVGDLSNEQLAKHLFEIWPQYLGYVTSFLVIGFFWAAHQRKFRYIRRYDRVLLFLNLLLLMTIAFIPFPASLLSEYGNRTATIFYALVVALGGAISAAMWAYASFRNRLVDPSLDKHQRNVEILRTLSMSAIFLISIGIAFFNDDLAKLSWVLVIFTLLIFR